MYTCYIQRFKTLASFCSETGWFESYLVENPRRHILCDVAQIYFIKFISTVYVKYCIHSFVCTWIDWLIFCCNDWHMKIFALTCLYLLTWHLALPLRNASGNITLESRDLYSALLTQNDTFLIYLVLYILCLFLSWAFSSTCPSPIAEMEKLLSLNVWYQNNWTLFTILHFQCKQLDKSLDLWQCNSS